MFPYPSAASGDPPFDMVMSFSQRTAPVARSRLITLLPAAVQTPEAVMTIPPGVPQKVPGVNEAIQRIWPAGASFSVWTTWGWPLLGLLWATTYMADEASRATASKLA